MEEDWRMEVVKRMYRSKITAKMLALQSHYTPQYISLVLNHERGNNQTTKRRIMNALEELEQEAKQRKRK